MAYSTLASQSDTPTAGPDHTYFEAVAANFTEIHDAFGARISEASAQSGTGGTSTYQVLFGTVDWDSSPTLTGTANRITIPTGRGGLWLVCPSVIAFGTGDGTGTGSLQLVVRKNAATDLYDAFYDIASINGITVSLTSPFTVTLSAADYLEVFLVQVKMLTAGSAPHLVEDRGVSLSAIWLSP